MMTVPRTINVKPAALANFWPTTDTFRPANEGAAISKKTSNRSIKKSKRHPRDGSANPSEKRAFVRRVVAEIFDHDVLPRARVGWAEIYHSNFYPRPVRPGVLPRRGEISEGFSVQGSEGELGRLDFQDDGYRTRVWVALSRSMARTRHSRPLPTSEKGFLLAITSSPCRAQRPYRAARQNASSIASPALSVTMPASSQTIWKIYIFPTPSFSTISTMITALLSRRGSKMTRSSDSTMTAPAVPPYTGLSRILPPLRTHQASTPWTRR